MIEDFIKQNNLPSFRVKQFNHAFYKEYINSFNDLTTWPKDLREKLNKTVSFSSITPKKEISSTNKDTTKVLFSRKSDNNLFESVLMRYKDDRNSVCVSSMIGCPVKCTFCATGKMKIIKNLKAEEIVDQVLYFARILKKENKVVTNIVFMGMGEPLLNLDEVMKAINILNDPELCGFGIRRITISTSGITPKIYELIKNGYKGRLALSLHAPNQKLREKLMPIAKNYPLNEVLTAISEYVKRTQLRVSYEYILIDGLNDRSLLAQELANLLREHKNMAHVNLIPFNPISGINYKKSTLESIHNFSKILTENGISNTFRVTMGDDIKAACGQLTTNS
jgi:23S rRNA (adenine2503-C2)-methyltransferase